MPEKDAPLATLMMAFRQALLMAVDAIEVYFNMPRTSDLRKQVKRKKADWHGDQGTA